jgi:hypothetical protein
MSTLLVIMVGLWMIVITWGVWNMYARPMSGLDPDDIDMIKAFMDKVRKMAAAAKREASRGPRG